MKRYIIILALFVASLLVACDRFLDEKSDKSYVLPNRLDHLQALLDYHSSINQAYSLAGENSSTDFYVGAANYNAMRDDYRNQYSWQPAMLFRPASNDWRRIYDAIYTINTVLDALPRIPRAAENAADWDYIYGQGLVHRALLLFNAATIWAPAYDEETAGSALGIPLRLTADFTKSSARASVEKTYEQICTDLRKSIDLLPVTSINAYRVTKPLAYGALAKVLLSMHRYHEARLYADSCLRLRGELMNFNDLSLTSNTPIHDGNPENIFCATYASYPHFNSGTALVSPDLYMAYAEADLRKDVFFRKLSDDVYTLKGHYTGSSGFFAGLSVNEVLLIRAECAARAGATADAADDLNYLLSHRHRPEGFTPVQIGTPETALQFILIERRKELPFRGLRWVDVKRLNVEGADIALVREIDGQVYTLPPNDPRYALPIPEDIIEMTGMPQNPR